MTQKMFRTIFGLSGHPMCHFSAVAPKRPGAETAAPKRPWRRNGGAEPAAPKRRRRKVLDRYMYDPINLNLVI